MTRVKTLTATAAIAALRIVKWGANPGEATQSSAAADKHAGVSSGVPAEAAGRRVDVIMHGPTPVTFGGNVQRGDPLTADANGKAIKAVPAAGAQMRIVGWSETDAADGDIGDMFVQPGVITAAAA